MIKNSKQSGKKQFLAQNVVFFVFHQVRRKEKEEGEKSSGVGIFTLLKLITKLFIISGTFCLCVFAELWLKPAASYQ